MWETPAQGPTASPQAPGILELASTGNTKMSETLSIPQGNGNTGTAGLSTTDPDSRQNEVKYVCENTYCWTPPLEFLIKQPGVESGNLHF